MTADLYIAHNLGALPAAVKAARKAKVPCSFDAEDFHRGDLGEEMIHLYGLVTALEEKYLPQCAYITAAAPLIATAYERALGMTNIRVINNVFSRRYIQPVSARNDETLKLFWFSQSIGPERGLELIVSAMGLLPACNIELHLLGSSTESYRNELREKALRSEHIHFLDPVAPQDIFPLAAGFDIGMASEVPHCENRDICLTNKLFTYLLAGNCILASNTSAQKKFLTDYPGIGIVYDHSAAADLAEKLSFFYCNRQALLDSRRQASRLAADSLNWEKESRILLDLVTAVTRPS
jgi:glycosyltransferase involved in cell wall biosynthesis